MYKIKYREGYDYQLAETYVYPTDIIGYSVEEEFIQLSLDGILTIKKGYAWDGASSAVDTNNFMRGSLVHDALYQLIRDCALPKEIKTKADQILHDLCKEDGMSSFRAWYVKEAVTLFGGKASSKNPYPVLEAP